jgi:peptidoglycan-N-acetylglucosamine deacetylase
MGIRTRTASVLVCCAMLAAALVAVGSVTTSASAAVVPCSRGLVALTFDDGPRSIVTPKLLTLLRNRRVPATFFVVGQRVRALPNATRRASKLGFKIGNHTFAHENLTHLSDARVKRTLLRTQRAIRAAGARPSTLMRPPYGSINRRVRRLVRQVGLVPVLWTVDPRDWDARSATSIARSTIRQLRPHTRNVVLLHDGVANSTSTLQAVPRIIRSARGLGYCFAGLDSRGVPRPPVPLVRVSDASATERPGGSVMRATVTLDRATSRRTSVRVRTIAGTATAGSDFRGLDKRVWFPVGTRKRVVNVRVRDDLRDEPNEQITIRLSQSRGQRVKDGVAIGRIFDNDLPPRVTLPDTTVTEPTEGKVQVPIRMTLSRPSERWIRMRVVTTEGSATQADYVHREQRFTFAPGVTNARFLVTVLSDDQDEDVERFGVRVMTGRNVNLSGAEATVTIVPPAT